MKVTVRITSSFKSAAKPLLKKYHSLLTKADVDNFSDNYWMVKASLYGGTMLEIINRWRLETKD